MMDYNKLIRDKIPGIIEKTGKKPAVHKASDEEYWLKLKEKLEEAGEFIKNEDKEEIADILEIIEAICDFKKIDKNEIEIIKKKKASERGKFTGRLILDRVI